MSPSSQKFAKRRFLSRCVAIERIKDSLLLGRHISIIYKEVQSKGAINCASIIIVASVTQRLVWHFQVS